MQDSKFKIPKLKPKFSDTSYAIMFTQDSRCRTFKAVSIINEYTICCEIHQQNNDNKNDQKIKSIISLIKSDWVWYVNFDAVTDVWMENTCDISVNYSMYCSVVGLLFWFDVQVNCLNERKCLFSVSKWHWMEWQWHFIFFRNYSTQSGLSGLSENLRVCTFLWPKIIIIYLIWSSHR